MMLPYTPEAYKLLHDGSIALAQVEANGIRVDPKYIASTIESTKVEIVECQRKMADSKTVKVWRRHFRSRTNLGSNEQLGTVLFDVIGHKNPSRTETGRYKTDEEALAMINDPFVKEWLHIKKLQKVVERLSEVDREREGDILHAVFNLHTVRTYRSSSDAPNFQNFPTRVEWIKERIRRAFLARKGRRIIEKDYKGIEVRGAYCYHRDPTMHDYLLDDTKDMHRDMAMECYMLPQSEVTKGIRHAAKNQFVFPQFYGAWWLDCAAGLWNIIDTMTLVTTSGVPLRDHLKAKGIKRLGDQNPENYDPARGTFEAHIQKIEQHFWKKRFPVYSKWKKRWYEDYVDKGWFQTLTGFICQGFMSRNDVINYPVQGSSFHCLLWSLIQIVREIRKRKMKALVIGQIHDSIISDVPDEEVEEYTEMAEHIMTKAIMDHWKWIITPLDVEVEMTPVGGSWVDKKEVKK